MALLRSGKSSVDNLKKALSELQTEISTCPQCFFWTQTKHCPLCESYERSATQLCIVRDCPDVIALERFRKQGWQYHVLQGLLSPLNGVGPSDVRINELFTRIKEKNVTEMIIALDATIEGDATALYIRDRLSEEFPHVKVSRTALGLPAGSSVEYLDPSTLEHALRYRTEF